MCLEASPVSYSDKNSYTSELDLEQCYNRCAFNFSCLAIEWNDSICSFIASKASPIPCPDGTICSTMLGE